VVDASDADPEAQIRAVREVLADIDALHVPEQLVFNKVDAADPEMLLRLKRLAPDGLLVSARTGAGLEELTAEIERRLPVPEVEVTALLPYTRGDLVARLHDSAEVLRTEHTPDGTLVSARVSPAFAAVLAPFAPPAGVAWAR
jgi:GTP-binding protein HflX